LSVAAATLLASRNNLAPTANKYILCVAGGRFPALLENLFPLGAQFPLKFKGPKGPIGRFPAFLKNMFPFREFCTPSFYKKGVQIFDFCRKTPKQHLQEQKKQGRRGFTGEQKLKKPRKTPGAPETTGRTRGS